MSQERNRTELSRRKALKGIGGSSIGIFGSGVAIAGSSDDRVIITTMKAGDKPIEQKSVPKSWYTQQQRVNKVLNQSREGLHSIEGVIGVGVGRSERTIEGRNAGMIEVFVDPDGHGKVPAEISGIETEISEMERPSLTSCNEKNYDPIPGGVTMEGASGQGTSGCEVENEDRFMLTAAHLFLVIGVMI